MHFRGNDGIPINREIFGPGVRVADYDGDGYQDIYFVNGRDLYQRGISARNALYRNNGDGTFTDVTERAGVSGAKFKWPLPDGTTQRFTGLPTNRYITIVEGQERWS
ncbi:MAG TPA: VCBS repeat-containing protein [Candidatus Acidoferrum sp.]